MKFLARFLPAILLAYGLILRLAQYLANRSLWLDESFLAVNILHRSFTGLLLPLDHAQAAPIGFLLMERAAVLFFGDSEYALRLLPLLAGVGALFLLYALAKLILTPRALLIALGLFAINNSLIYYSSELKQYSSDLAISLILLLAVYQFALKPVTARGLSLLILISVPAIWFSYPAIFILSGAGLGLLLHFLHLKDWRKAGWLGMLLLLCFSSFIFQYLFSLKPIIAKGELYPYWAGAGAFFPLPPKSLSDFLWPLKALLSAFDNPLDLHKPFFIPFFLFLAGCLIMFKKQRAAFLLLAGPLLMTLLAAALHKYPFQERLLLFTIPSFVIIIACAGDHLITAFKAIKNSKVRFLLLILLLYCLFYRPLLIANHYLLHSRTKDELKPVLNYLLCHHQKGDSLYYFESAHCPLAYYGPKFNLSHSEYSMASFAGKAELKALCPRGRAWLLFSSHRGLIEEQHLVEQMTQGGKLLDSFKAPGSSLYLFYLKE